MGLSGRRNPLRQYYQRLCPRRFEGWASRIERRHGRKTLLFKLQTAAELIPYIKLVERERLRAPLKLRACSVEPRKSTPMILCVPPWSNSV